MDRNRLASFTEAEKEELWQKERVEIARYKSLLDKELGRSAGWFEVYWRWNSEGRDKWLDSLM